MVAPPCPANSSSYLPSKNCWNAKNTVNMGQAEANDSKSRVTQDWKSHRCLLPFNPSVTSALAHQSVSMQNSPASKQTIFELKEAAGHAIKGLPFPLLVLRLKTLTRPHSRSVALGPSPCPQLQPSSPASALAHLPCCHTSTLRCVGPKEAHTARLHPASGAAIIPKFSTQHSY